LSSLSNLSSNDDDISSSGTQVDSNYVEDESMVDRLEQSSDTSRQKLLEAGGILDNLDHNTVKDGVMKDELLEHILNEMTGEPVKSTTTKRPTTINASDFHTPCPQNSVYVPPDCIILETGDNMPDNPENNTIVDEVLKSYTESRSESCHDIRKFNTLSLNPNSRRTLETLCLKDGFAWSHNNCSTDEEHSSIACTIQVLLQSHEWSSSTSNNSDVIRKMIIGQKIHVSELHNLLTLSIPFEKDYF